MRALFRALWRRILGRLWCPHVWHFDDAANPPPCPCCGPVGPAWQRCRRCGARRRIVVVPRVYREG